MNEKKTHGSDMSGTVGENPSSSPVCYMEEFPGYFGLETNNEEAAAIDRTAEEKRKITMGEGINDQVRLTEGPLLDGRGTLAQAGWATSLVREYDRSAIRAPWHRIKEWDYYCIANDRFAVGAVVADNSYMGLLGLAFFDFEKKTFKDVSSIEGMTKGKYRMPATSQAGHIHVKRPDMEIEIKMGDGKRHLRVECPGYGRGQGFSLDTRLEDRMQDTMVIATPFPKARKAFYYNQKINGLAASGTLKIGDRTEELRPDRDFGVLDWGRGVWTYQNRWYWGSATGMQNGVLFGMNIGYGFGDTSAASENMVMVDGVAHKLDKVEFHIPSTGYDCDPWRFSSNDGRLELTFEPIVDRDVATNLLILKSVTHQVFGWFSGRVILDDGSEFKIDNLIGFAEEVFNRF